MVRYGRAKFKAIFDAVHFLLRASLGQKSPFRTFPLANTFGGVASKTAKMISVVVSMPTGCASVPFERTLCRIDREHSLSNVMTFDTKSGTEKIFQRLHPDLTAVFFEFRKA